MLCTTGLWKTNQFAVALQSAFAKFGYSYHIAGMFGGGGVWQMYNHQVIYQTKTISNQGLAKWLSLIKQVVAIFTTILMFQQINYFNFTLIIKFHNNI